MEDLQTINNLLKTYVDRLAHAQIAAAVIQTRGEKDLDAAVEIYRQVERSLGAKR